MSRVEVDREICIGMGMCEGISAAFRVGDSGTGLLEGRVRMNVYLGHSIECFVETKYGEVLVQIDDPASKKIYPEGAPVSVDFDHERVRLLPDDAK